MKILHVLMLATASCLLLGCTQSTPSPTTPVAEAEHGHQLETLAEGVEQLKGYRDEVKAAFDAGTPNECDNALHEASHVLEALPNAGDISSLSAEDKAAVEQATKDLFALFLQIHEGFHSGDEVQTNAYESVAEEMNAALETLSSKAQATQ